MILILKTGYTAKNIQAACGDYEDWITKKMQLSANDYQIHYTENYDDIPAVQDLNGIVITGSPLMVTDINLNGSKLIQWILDHQNSGTPILGICFGHQLLNVINGGTVNYNRDGIVIGTSPSTLNKEGMDDQLTGSLPDTFTMHRVHSQSVFELPESAAILSNDSTGNIDMIRFNPNCWGVQFHPEFNSEIMRRYIDEKKETLFSEGIDISKLLRNINHIDQGKLLLQKFKEIVNA